MRLLRALGLDKLLGRILIVNKFALADMSVGLRLPNLVGKIATLTLGMFVRAAGVHARVEFAGSLDMGESAALILAVGTIAAEWHVWMLEMTMWVGAVRKEPAHFLGLMSRPDGRRWVTTGAFMVLASNSKGTNIGGVD